MWTWGEDKSCDSWCIVHLQRDQHLLGFTEWKLWCSVLWIKGTVVQNRALTGRIKTNGVKRPRLKTTSGQTADTVQWETLPLMLEDEMIQRTRGGYSTLCGYSQAALLRQLGIKCVAWGHHNSGKMKALVLLPPITNLSGGLHWQPCGHNPTPLTCRLQTHPCEHEARPGVHS